VDPKVGNIAPLGAVERSEGAVRKKGAVGWWQSMKSKSEVRAFDGLYITHAEHDSKLNKFSQAKNHHLVVRNLY
jgi:hypothetical protein